MPRRYINKNMPSFRPRACNLCGKILSRKATLVEHIQDFHSSNKKISCTIKKCNYKTNRVGNYNLHLRTVHKIDLPVVTCYSPECGKRSRNEYSVIKHMGKCKGNPKFETIKCMEENCKEEFLTKNGLEAHLKMKHDCLSEKDKRVDIKIFHKEIEELISI